MSTNWDSEDNPIEPIDNRAEIKVKCGDFHHGEIVSGKLEHYMGLNNFCFTLGRHLTADDFDQMKAARSIKLAPSKKLMYSARIYTTELAQIKLYFDYYGKRIYRAKILDLYPRSSNGQIEVRVKINKIDRSQILWVNFDSLFDFPHQARNYMKLRPESFKCKLHISKYLSYDKKKALNHERISAIFRKNIDINKVDIKIMDFKDEVYDVDLISREGKSLITLITQECSDLIEFNQSSSSVSTSRNSEDEKLDSFMPANYKPYHKIILRNPDNNREARFISAIDFFRSKLDECNRCYGNLAIHNSICRVRVGYWTDPHHLFIVPADEDFGHFRQFRRVLDKDLGQSFDITDPIAEQRIYKIGQYCLYLNDDGPCLFNWSRGVVIGIPTFLKMPVSVLELSDKKKYDMVYKIRSIDYGDTVFRQNSKMRVVTNDKVFSRVSPFCLRAKLFGVHPLPNSKNSQFNLACSNGVDVWIRERILENEKTGCSYFYALFRNLHGTIYNKRVRLGYHCGEITLLHRIEGYRRSLDDAFHRNKKRQPYNCLNTHLIEKGFASDCIPNTNKFSDVQIDEYLVNLFSDQGLM